MNATPSPINAQTPGPLNHWPTHWAGGADSRKLDGHNTLWLDSPRAELARLVPNGGRIDALVLADARLLASAYTSFDKAGRELGIDAATLARDTDVAALIRFRAGVVKCLDQLADSPLSFMDNIRQGVKDTEGCAPKVRG